MIITVQAHEYQKYSGLMDQMFRLRKKVFADQLNWDVPVIGDMERDIYDNHRPVYLMWCSDDQSVLYGVIRLMPTTGPTLLYDVFRNTFPDIVSFEGPGIWEGTRMCVDEELLARDHPEVSPARAFSLLLLALCEVALKHGIHSMVSNYEPQMKRIYMRTGIEVNELGRADEYGKYPVCCGLFEVSEAVLQKMRAKLNVSEPLFRNVAPENSVRDILLNAA